MCHIYILVDKDSSWIQFEPNKDIKTFEETSHNAVVTKVELRDTHDTHTVIVYG